MNYISTIFSRWGYNSPFSLESSDMMPNSRNNTWQFNLRNKKGVQLDLGHFDFHI